ncbi:NADH-quinone oxidoreductase subunit B family protein [Rubripirellula reticaptiva]|uniref:NAD-reducing hydrogenase HoxS subunit delta n=1 Tax=Rubripirellula reticaptiva TaxID=2528013 RepID=A0A5C6EHK8_9BACT|nr:oxidoreductase [Rubripirellula reticaptiva]TWU46699.1 NAD-reducing hydrogenase HoxS subunit delta [Rubripirellula reticaptiva]
MNLLQPPPSKKRLGVFKFASCDGCQLSLLSCEDELLEVAGKIEIAHFLEASSEIKPGPYDIALVEGSITTPSDIERIRHIRQQSKTLVTIGACATSGGIQALRNWGDHEEFISCVYTNPAYIESLATSTAIANHVSVDFELRGCPIDRYQLLEVLTALIADRQPRTPQHSVCMECKRRGTVCLSITRALPCLGPVTQAGCGAICPAYDRACYGCFGPAAQANCPALSQHYLATGTPATKLVHALRNMNAGAEIFQIESDRLERGSPER